MARHATDVIFIPSSDFVSNPVNGNTKETSEVNTTEPTPLTRHERRELLEQHGVEMLTTLGEVVERLSLWNEHLPDGPRQKADEFKAKVNNLVLRATGGAS